MKNLLSIFFLLVVLLPVNAQQRRMSTVNPHVTLSVEHFDGQYALGEQVKVFADVDSLAFSKMNMTLTVNGIKQAPTIIDLKEGRNVILQESYSNPAGIIVALAPLDYPFARVEIGFVAGKEGFKAGFEAPDDLKKFWKGEIKEMRKEKMDVRMTPVALEGEDAEKYMCWDVEINCRGGRPVRGYLGMPKDAKKRSLPAVLFTRAAGVAGDWCQAHVWEVMEMVKWGNGAIVFDINAHGMANDGTAEYYNNLENGELKNYSNIGVTDRNEYYFRGMYLRVIRALDFLCMQEAWDGKRLLTTGESQGGGQAAAAAGLDKRVGASVLRVPAMIDLGGYSAGRLSGWPMPYENNKDNSEAVEKVIKYFDVAQILRGSKASFCVEIGLTDTTCPASAVMSGMNNTKGDVTVLSYPYRSHHEPQPPYYDEWKNTVYKERMEFINNYLK